MEVEEVCKQALEKADYELVLEQTSTLKESIDTFFDDVKVMSDDEEIKENRLALLALLQKILAYVGDLSVLSVESKDS